MISEERLKEIRKLANDFDAVLSAQPLRELLESFDELIKRIETLEAALAPFARAYERLDKEWLADGRYRTVAVWVQDLAAAAGATANTRDGK